MPDSLYLQTFDQCGLNLFLLARFIPDGVLLIFPYLFMLSGSDQFMPCVVRLLSSLHPAHQALHPATPCRGLWFALIEIRSPYPARDPLG
jgi:hypothetical protein